MAKTIDEIMNTEVFTLRPEESAQTALHYIIALGITGAPVTDRDLKLVGHASFRDLLSCREGATIAECMRQPVAAIGPHADIAEAGRQMAEQRVHRLIVVDRQSRVIGVVSTLDVVAALVGKPEVHPSAFPHFDRETGITWTDQIEWSEKGAAAAPDGPGILMFIESAPGRADRIAWVESASNVRSRVRKLLSSTHDEPLLAELLGAASRICFRAASVERKSERSQIVDNLRIGVARRYASLFGCDTEATLARTPLSNAVT